MYSLKSVKTLFVGDAWLLDVHSLTWIEIDAFKQMRLVNNINNAEKKRMGK